MKHKFPIVKTSLSSDFLGYSLAYEVFESLYSKGYIRDVIVRDIKVRVSFKDGKRRKLKNVKFLELGYVTRCSCCGPELLYTYK